jgi:4-diphosphocytidyl-2-C-methyl-D-erythritol kinase
LNLALELTGRRPDGYHELSAISQTIDWSDVVALEGEPPGPGALAEVPQLQVWGPEAHRVPAGEENLAVRAALLMREHGLDSPVTRIGLEKRIPPQSGLGGGSSDAAAVLRLAGLGLPPAKLTQIALACGADVPFSLRGGTGWLRGVGEMLTQLPSLDRGAFLIVVLGAVSTAAAYSATEPVDFSDGIRIERMADSLRQGQDLTPDLFGSSLQHAALRAVPDLATRLARLKEATPGVAWAMTGSGGAFFSYQPDATSAARLARLVAPACPGCTVRVALPATPEPD